MSVSEKIKTVKTIYPQIYAYTLPDINSKDGWVKIGYTERENVDSRILEQTRTAAIKLNYDKLWSGPAKFNNSDGWFKDYQLHSYLIKQKHREQEKGSEWFYYNGYPDKSYSDYLDYCNFKINQESEQMDYQLRFEQEEAIKKTLSYMKKYKGNEELKFLWNAKPRFGKTLTTYDLARRLNASRVLIVTNRPAIANSWYDDFEKFIAWQTDYAFVSTTDSLKDRPVLEREDFVRQLCSENGKKSLISFISLQDLKGAIDFGGPYQKLAWVKDLEWDLLVIDESHEGVDTIKTDVAFRKIKSRFSLYLSGTPFKAIASGDFREDQIFNWSYADEQKAKQNWKDSNKNNPYKNLPQLNMFTYKMSEMITEEVNKGADIDGENVDYAFDLNEFFSTNDDGSFVYESDVIKWLDSLTTREKYPFSTSKLRNELKHTFWLLNRVASAKALEKLLKTHKTFSDYKVILAAGDGRSTDDQIINEKSLERVRKAINKYERTITLSVGQLTTGVTVPEWTGVLMLTNIKSPSLYMQAAFRAQNSWVYEENGQMKQKQNAYIFDFSPERTLIIYDEFANNLNAETVSGSGTTDDRENNIKTLLNFFPVIAEDEDGSMVELDVTKVLTIPKTIKAREVVRRGFMSNFLFQNVSGVFSSEKAREILEKLEPVERGKNKTRKTDEKIDTLGIEVNELGIVKIDEDELKNTVEAKFGKKIYKDFDYTYEALEKNSK
ncbi:DEAD/DEAH box helicase, partial [Enterococcus sp. 5B3_DIV0040]|uniref:DEAD/DEAH box helicase n=1 Tax=Enterococcus sp. 5B3_DIV0040 TaxID=1834182 RepID=UPI001592C833